VQQLSLVAPHAVVPAPPLPAQLGGAWQLPEKQLAVVDPQYVPSGTLLNAVVLVAGRQL
jgi:hypothetical protein